MLNKTDKIFIKNVNLIFSLSNINIHKLLTIMITIISTNLVLSDYKKPTSKFIASSRRLIIIGAKWLKRKEYWWLFLSIVPQSLAVYTTTGDIM